MSIYKAKKVITQNYKTPQLEQDHIAMLKSELNQNFSCFERTNTHASFKSDDGALSITLFLNQPSRLSKNWTHFIPGLGTLDQYRTYLKGRSVTFRKLPWAFDKLKNKSLLRYYHFAPTTVFGQKVNLVDERGGILHLDLDQGQYAIAERAIDVKDALAKGSIDEAKKYLEKAFDFMLRMDREWIKNVHVGFAKDEPRILNIETIKTRAIPKLFDIEKITNPLAVVVKEVRPELLEHFELLLEQSD